MSRRHKREKKVWIFLAAVFIIIIAIIVFAMMNFSDENNTGSDSSANGTIEDETEESYQIEIVEKSDASYERWLAAGMVTAVSMQYPDFEIEGIYLTGETDPADKMQSGGAYVIFTADGTETAVQSTPLEAERTDAGTTDLYTRDLGFATFDVVDPAQIDTGACVAVSMDELEELISQSLLVSLYEH